MLKKAVLILSAALLNTACSDVEFVALKSDSVMKSGRIGTGLLPDEPNLLDDGPSASDQGDGATDDGPTTGTPGTGTPGTGTPGTGLLPVKRMCSNNGTASAKTNVKQAASLALYIVKTQKSSFSVTEARAAQEILCSYTRPGVKEQLTSKRALDLQLCGNVREGGDYHVVLIDPATPNGADAAGRDTFANLLTIKGGTSNVKVSRGKLFRPAGGEEKSGLMALYDINQTVGDEAIDAECDQRASPLVVHLKSDVSRPQPIDLTSPIDGILFDILGERARPYAHAKNQISWIRNAEDYRFLVKPNGFGDVNGIDELFGDNTKGPDGRFAKDGFHALAKYDSNRDRVIDAKDAVYRSLRLWADYDFDGASTKNELISLGDAGVKSIDLNADPRYVEQDEHGNITTLKSLVKFQNGSQRLIFDVWFRL